MMFVYSMRASTLKFFGVIALSVAVLFTLIAFIPTTDPIAEASAAVSASDGVKIRYDKIKSEEDVVSFLSQFGWTVSEKPLETEEVTVPSEFDKVFLGYNEIQKGQGLDLSKYRRKQLTRYTYEVLNFPDYEGKVYANVLVYRNKVVGGDLCTADMSGFICGFNGYRG